MASVVSEVAHEGGLLLFLSTLDILGFPPGFFFSLEFSKPRKYSRVWYINVLSYHDVNGIGLDFLPIFFPPVHEHRRMYLPCMNCPEMMSEDILSLVYIYLSENV